MHLDVNITPTTDFTLEPWSYSRLTDINTCETWGMVRGAYRKSFPTSGRSLALEAGSAAHMAFAALRLYNLLEQGHIEHFNHHIRRVFGKEKGSVLAQRLRGSSEPFLNAISLAIDALHMSGYYDDPMDKRRTMSNIEEAIYAYAKSTIGRQNPVYIQDAANPSSMVGIELPFDFTINLGYDHQHSRTIRYIGQIDALHVSQKTGRPYVEENKTASRLGDAWAASFEVSQQVTGYCVFASALLDIPIREALIRGVSLPQPRKNTTYTDGVCNQYVTRTDDQLEQFFKWVFLTHAKRIRIGDDIENAMQETHSCNRYFQACSLIPFCNAGSADERKVMLEEMVTIDLSPSEQAALEKSGE